MEDVTSLAVDGDESFVIDHTPEPTNFELEAEEIQAAASSEIEQIDESTKPFIDHLSDAVIDGQFIVDVGGLVIVERWYKADPSTTKWLDTRSYTVKKVNQESGFIRLFDHEMKQDAATNFKSGLERGYRFKIPTDETRLTGKGKSRPKKSTPAKKAKDPNGKRGNPGKPGVRRIYNVKGVICTRLKNIAYVAPEGTRAKEAERLMVSAPKNDCVIISHSDGWEETWHANHDM